MTYETDRLDKLIDWETKVKNSSTREKEAKAALNWAKRKA